MTIATPDIAFHFPPDFDERAEYEMTLKGHLCGGEIELPAGRRFPITFFDPVRLSQDLEMTSRRGELAFIEPSLVVISEVTREVILRTLPELMRQRFFDHLKPLAAPTVNRVAG